MGIYIVWEVHNIHSDLSKQLKFNNKKIIRLQKRECYVSEISDAILCRSRQDMSKLLKISSEPQSKFHIYKGCIETSLLKNTKPNFNGRRLVTFGNFYYEPNRRMLLILSKIMMKLYRMDKKIVLDVVGDIPKGLEEKISSSNIIVHRFVPNITKILNKVALLIAPIDTGSGTRVKLLVAMAAGMPVITTTKGAEGLEYKNKIIISDKFADYPSLIMKILTNKKLYNKLSVDGRKFVQKKYDWSTNIDKVINVYKKMILR
ncbi:glycosyltransferase family 4 protein [Candidatus Marsarchaeota archaeon]|nr:glycosyltransferase family 4 protein [Candidatus Marsarchaeota archaeon]